MLAVTVIMVLGMSHAEAYNGNITITDLIFYSFEMGDFFILEGTFGPELVIGEPVMVNITEKDTETIVHRNGIKIYDLGGYVQEDEGGRVWMFSGPSKISSSGTVELGNNVPERLELNTPYTIKLQYDDMFTEMDFELTSTDKKYVIITDKTPQGFPTRSSVSEHSSEDNDMDITRYMQVGHGPILRDRIYNQEDYRVSTDVKYAFENADGTASLYIKAKRARHLHTDSFKAMRNIILKILEDFTSISFMMLMVT